MQVKHAHACRRPDSASQAKDSWMAIGSLPVHSSVKHAETCKLMRETAPRRASAASAAEAPAQTRARLELVARGSAWLVILTAAALIGVLVRQSWPILRQAHEFFTLREFNVSQHQFGAWAYIYGTPRRTSLIAMSLAVPLGTSARRPT